MAENKAPCPSCGHLVGEGDIICVQCGMNLLTGMKVPRGEAARAGRKIPWGAIVGTIAGVALLALVAAAVITIFMRDPVERARQAGRGGNPLDGIEILSAYTVNKPEDPAGHFVMGQLLWETEEYARAAEQFDTASRLNPTDEDAALLAVVAAEKGVTADRLNTQLAALRRLVEEEPRNVRALYLLALALGAVGDHVGQVNALERVLVQSDAPVPEGVIRTQLAAAQALLGQPEAAQEQILIAQSLRSGDGDVLAMQGFLASAQGQEKIAADALEGAVAASSSVDGLAKGRLGLVLLEEGRYSDALALLRDAKNAPGATPAAAFYHAVALQLNGLEAEALSAYDAIASERGKFAGEAALQMAEIHLQQNNLDPAAEAIRRAQTSGESSARLYTLQGRMSLAEGNLGEAQNSFRQAIQLDKDYAPAHLENGLAYVARGSLDEGIRELRRYLELVGPENPGGRYPEIELLVNQLEEAGDSAARGVVQAAR